MYALGSQMNNLPIISLQTGQTVAILGQPIINPDKLEVVAFFLWTGKWKRTNQILLAQDIRRLSPDGIVIDSFDEIEDANDIIRLKAIIDQHFELVGVEVVNESGVKLGKVEDYSLHAEDFTAQKLYVKQSLLKNMLLNSLVIDRSQILDVTPKQIMVRDAVVKEPMMSPVTPAIPE